MSSSITYDTPQGDLSQPLLLDANYSVRRILPDGSDYIWGELYAQRAQTYRPQTINTLSLVHPDAVLVAETIAQRRGGIVWFVREYADVPANRTRSRNINFRFFYGEDEDSLREKTVIANVTETTAYYVTIAAAIAAAEVLPDYLFLPNRLVINNALDDSFTLTGEPFQNVLAISNSTTENYTGDIWAVTTFRLASFVRIPL
jgi:hypothetical protein